jgi:DOPA 4,5-dioxygenase
MPKPNRTRSSARPASTSNPRRRARPIENFHAHVYYDAATREQAQKLCAAAGKKFGAKVGRMHDNPVGPHPRGSCQLTVEIDRFAEVVPWLILHRSALTIFAHAQTGDALKDHTDHVLWLGPSEKLKLSALS